MLTPDTLSRWAGGGGGSAMCLSVCLRSALIGLRTAAFLWIMHSVDAFRETLDPNSGRRKLHLQFDQRLASIALSSLLSVVRPSGQNAHHK